jgi:hypothetical protein
MRTSVALPFVLPSQRCNTDVIALCIWQQTLCRLFLVDKQRYTLERVLDQENTVSACFITLDASPSLPSIRCLTLVAPPSFQLLISAPALLALAWLANRPLQMIIFGERAWSLRWKPTVAVAAPPNPSPSFPGESVEMLRW